MSTIHLATLIIAQVSVCHNPTPLEWGIIVTVVGGILALSGVGITGIVSVAGTLVPMIVAGASFDSIAATIAGMASTIGSVATSLEIVTQLVIIVKSILGC
ncbi:hypothetical protein [Scytonema sp. NUACC26]|uniref:hypothetical protein n=1 Tax=Scytonema sp. NUACC26 TaxID=3140176 RepID=UPI0034DC3979